MGEKVIQYITSLPIDLLMCENIIQYITSLLADQYQWVERPSIYYLIDNRHINGSFKILPHS